MNPFEQIPEVSPLPVAPEIPRTEKEVPIEVIEGALEHLNIEDKIGVTDEKDIQQPTIH